MSPDVVIVLVVLGASFVLFIKEWLRADLVAMLVLLSLVVSGLVDTGDAIAGFSSPAIITVCSIYVISAGLYKTGVAGILGRRIMGLAGKSERKLIVALMVVTAVLSFFMNTVGIVALMLPVVMDISRTTGRAPSKLLMPLAFGALLGGLTTPFATLSNILVSSTMQDFGLEPFHLLDFAPIGSVAAIAGILFLAIVAPVWLPDRVLEKARHLPGAGELKSQYHLHDRMFVLKLPAGSVLRGKTLQGTRLGSALGLHVVAILRNPEMLLAPSPTTLLREGDRLLVQGSPDQLKDLESWRSLIMRERGEAAESLLSKELEFDEFEVPEKSVLIGQNIIMLDFRSRFGSNLLGVRRGRQIEKRNLRNWVFEAGDVLLVECTRVQGMILREFTGWKHLRTCNAAEVRRDYQIEERLFVAEIPEGSRLAGHSLGESRFGEALNFTTLEIIRGDQHIFNPQKNEVLLAGDQLVMNGQRENLDLLLGIQDLELERHPA